MKARIWVFTGLIALVIVIAASTVVFVTGSMRHETPATGDHDMTATGDHAMTGTTGDHAMPASAEGHAMPASTEAHATPATTEGPAMPATTGGHALPATTGDHATTASFASITATPESGSAPLAVSLRTTDYAHAMFGAVTKYNWDLGDGAKAEGLTAEHTYTQKGKYTVTLKIFYQDGTQQVARKTIEAK